MEKYFAGIKDLGLQNIAAWLAQERESTSTSHGGFDNDELTRNNVIGRIRIRNSRP
jgi:hypothetical protein